MTDARSAGVCGAAHRRPVPVFLRISFGGLGANFPAFVRAIIAIAWYGIQPYLATLTVNVLMKLSHGWPRSKIATSPEYLTPAGSRS